MIRNLLAAIFFAALLVPFALAQPKETRESKVRGDREEVEGDGYWIYNDLEKAFAEAKESKKPLLVVFRCIPCEACAQLDSEIVERDDRVKKLLDQFVCVRVVQANGLDLKLFQYDYDQSFAAFFMNADKTIYGRYGTRSHQTESENDVHIDGFARALEKALELHREYPKNKAALAGKQGGSTPAFPMPEKYPLLNGKYTDKLNYDGNVVQSCIHCHQVGEAQRQVFHDKGNGMPDRVLFPYPNPKALGLVLDPKQPAVVQEVMLPALDDGFEKADEIVSLAGQPLLSIADVQWVLHNVANETELPVVVRRGGEEMDLVLTLPDGWRRRDSISWRATSWSLRRMVLGGLLLEEVPDEEREKLNLAEDKLALRAKHVGQYGPHALAQSMGFQRGDVLIIVAGRDDRWRETDLIAWLANDMQIGDEFPVTVLRDGKKLELKLRIQE